MTVKVSVGHILEGAFGLIRERFGAVAVWAGVYLTVNLASLAVMGPLAQSWAAAGASDNIAEMASAMGSASLVSLVMALVGIVLYAAAMRAVLRPEAGGPGFLRLGADELRLFTLLLLFGVMGAVLIFVVSFGIGILVAIAAAGSQSGVLTIVIGIVSSIVLFALSIFLVLRLSLAFPLTLHRRRLAIGEAWRLSKGRFWTLFGAALVVTVIGFVLMTVTGIFTAGSYLADLMAASGDAEASAAAMEAQMTRAGAFTPAMILQTIAGAATGAVWIALSGGSAATAAKLLLANEFDDAETVFG